MHIPSFFSPVEKYYKSQNDEKCDINRFKMIERGLMNLNVILKTTRKR